jgi:hypothetical protein
LVANNIHCVVFDEHSGTLMRFIPGVQHIREAIAKQENWRASLRHGQKEFPNGLRE